MQNLSQPFPKPAHTLDTKEIPTWQEAELRALHNWWRIRANYARHITLLLAMLGSPSCPKRALVWGMVVRGFAHQDLC